MSKAVKRAGCVVFIILVTGFVYSGITFWRGANELLDAEQRGATYRNFFVVLDMYTEQTGAFPTSIQDMLLVQDHIDVGELSWPADAEQFVELINPNFDISPTIQNLDEFAPQYMQQADWGDTHCEFHWERIVENLETAP
jgi:hypothetical protein